jgi:hypothetical protein
VAFHYFATAQDLVEIYADIEAEAPIRVVYERDMPGSVKEYFFSLLEIPGVANDGTLTRCLPSFLAFPFQIEPELTEFDAMERRLVCMDRRDNPDAVEIKPPSLLFVDGFERPELNAGKVSFFARADHAGQPNPTVLARMLANRVRKAIRRRSCLMHTQGKTRIYIARRALEMARRKEISLACGWEVWSPAECEDDANRLERLNPSKSARRPMVSRTERSHNITPMRKFRIQTIEAGETDNPDQLFVAAYDDLRSIFDAACNVPDLNYSRLGPARFRSICQSANDLPGLGASSYRREIEAGIIAWRDETAEYGRVREPLALADYRIGLPGDGYTVPSIIVFPGGAHLRGGSRQVKRLFCGYVRIVRRSGQDHFDAFRQAVAQRHVDAVQVPGLPVDIPVLPEAKALVDAGIELDASMLSRHVMRHQAGANPGNVVAFPDQPGAGSG